MPGQALPAGQILADRYEIEKTLGQGGFGITYVAMDNKLLGRVAIKEYFPATLAERTKAGVAPLNGDCRERFARGKERFMEEARTLAGLSQTAAIVSVLGCFEEKGTAYMVMEYVPGKSLRTWLEEQETLPDFETAVTLLAPIFAAMEQVHKKGLIHRDICPDNLILGDNGTLTLIDFGAARVFYQQEEEALTRTVLVHQGYAPPEQYDQKGKQGPWTDVYGLAATLYEMLTGTMPPSAPERLGGEKLYPASAYGGDCTPEQEEALMRGLAMEGRERFSSIKAFYNALTPQSEEAAEASDRKKKGWLWGILTAVVLVAGILLWLCLGAGEEKSEPLAGNYPRGSEVYTQFMDFVKENAVEVVEEDGGTRYILEEDAVLEWGVPANRYTLEQTWQEVGEYLQEKGLQEDADGGWDIFWVREKDYGAITTRFDHVRVYNGEAGLQVLVCADLISGKVDMVAVTDGRADISNVIAPASELCAWLNGEGLATELVQGELQNSWEAYQREERSSVNLQLDKLEVWVSQQNEGNAIFLGRYGRLYVVAGAPSYWPD